MSHNLIKIYDGRTSFWQWDKGQRIIILNDSITEVHLSHKGVNGSQSLEIKNENNMRVCDIPDVFLQVPKNLIVYAISSIGESKHTITSIEIAIKNRAMPDGYISVHDDKYDDINNRFSDLSGRLDVIENIDRNLPNNEMLTNVKDRVDTLESYAGVIPDTYAEKTIIAYIDKKAEETLAATQGGGSSESASLVQQQLDNYKSENDNRVKATEDAIAAEKERVDGVLNIDYSTALAFDTSEIIFDTVATSVSVLGKAILGRMVLA